MTMLLSAPFYLVHYHYRNGSAIGPCYADPSSAMYVLSIPEMATEKYMHSATEDHNSGTDTGESNKG
jgi:hypothetical protein